MFVPSEYSYGDSVLDKASALLQSAAPALSIAQELAGKSAAEKVAILGARVKNYQRLMKTPPYSIVPGTDWYKSEITKMKAHITALSAEAASDQSATDDYSAWRKLTSVGGVVGIGLGLAVIGLVVQKARAA